MSGLFHRFRRVSSGWRWALALALGLGLAVGVGLYAMKAGYRFFFQPSPRPPMNPATPVFTCQARARYPHDRHAFTQGLAYRDGLLYESTGLYGHSSVRLVALETGRVDREHPLESALFGEGLSLWGDRVLQLTWLNGVGFIYDRADLRPLGQFPAPVPAWGMAGDGRRLLVSDGSAVLRVLEPESLREVGRLPVQDRGRPIMNLNELEFVRGELWANVWKTDFIARIDPDTGQIKGWIDCSGLSGFQWLRHNENVLNGIAYDTDQDRLLVTGKRWANVYWIEIVERAPE